MSDERSEPLSRALAWRLLGGEVERTHGRFKVWSTFQAEHVANLVDRLPLSDEAAFAVLRSRDTEGLAMMLPLASEYLVANLMSLSACAATDTACHRIAGAMAAAYDRHTRSGLACHWPVFKGEPIAGT